MKPIVISLEGPDGSGKTFAGAQIRKELEALGYSVLYIHELGTGLSEIKLSQWIDFSEPLTRDLVYAAATLSVQRTILRAKEDVVLVDRYIDSLLAYATVHLQPLESVGHVYVFLKEIARISPDFTVFFFPEDDVLLRRRQDRVEEVDLEFERGVVRRMKMQVKGPRIAYTYIQESEDLEDMLTLVCEFVQERRKM